MKIFLGLGNPGKKYRYTRHNAGQMVIDNFIEKVKKYTEKKYRYFFSYFVDIEGKQVILVKPRVFINESGIAFEKVAATYKAKYKDIVVIHDDLGIQTGKIKITFNKGDNGHKGIISIFSTIGTKDFYRIRIGIGREKIEIPYAEYVLSPFDEEEKEKIKIAIEKASCAITEIVKSGIEKAMTIYNR